MIPDILTVAWKEWKEYLLSGRGLRSGRAGLVIIIFVFGVMLPAQAGPEWLASPALLAAWAWVPLMLVAGHVADSFAGERERHTLETLLASRLPDRAILFGKISAAVGYAWGTVIVLMIVSMLAVNAIHWQGRLVTYSVAMLGGSLGFSLLTALLAASAGVLISLRAPTARQAAQVLSIGVMIVLFVPVFGFQALPPAWKASIIRAAAGVDLTIAVAGLAGLVAVADASLLMMAMARFRRARLILD